MTLGDPALQCEVLTMFVAQSARLLDQLTGLPADAGGCAYAEGLGARVGAFAVAEATERLEAALSKPPAPGRARRPEGCGRRSAGRHRGLPQPGLNGRLFRRNRTVCPAAKRWYWPD
jgi:hypothetical protein